jgi:hypothetical protein
VTKKLVDRFVCRRQGHVSALTFTKISGITPATILTRCSRCDKPITLLPPDFTRIHENEEPVS